MSATSLAASLRDELLDLLAPLGAAGTPAGFRALLASFGHTDRLAAQDPLRTALAQAAQSIDPLKSIDPAALDTWSGVQQVLNAGSSVITAVRGVEKAITDPALAARAKGLGQQIALRLVALHLRANHPQTRAVLSLLTLLAPAETAVPSPLVMAGTEIARMPWVDETFRLDRAGDLITRPWATLGEVYFPNQLARAADAAAAADRLFPLLAAAARAIGLRGYRDTLALDPPGPGFDGASTTGDHFSDQAPDTGVPSVAIDPAEALRRRMPRLSASLLDAGGKARVAVSCAVSSAEHAGGVAGVVATVAGKLAFTDTRAGWQVTATSDGDLPSFVIGPKGLALAPAAAAPAGATGRVSVTRVSDGGPAFIFGSATGTRLELGGVRFGLDFALTNARRAIALLAAVDRAKIVIAPGDGDGFLQKVLPSEGVSLDFNAGLMLSSDRGLDIGVGVGDAALAVLSGTTPVGRSIGPIRIESLSRDFHPVTTDRGTGVAVSVGVRASLNLGPVALTLDGPSVGVDALWSLKDATKTPNLGVIDIGGFGLRSPTGAALAVNGALVQGAGALKFDESRHQYAGVLALVVKDKFALEVAGLLTTRMPDGRPGFSLLLLGSLKFPPIPIGFGFSINGLGALIGIHRTTDVDALSGALAAGDLDTVLFPRDLTALAAVPDGLAKLFPAKQDAYTIGILASFTWGPSAIAQIELGIVYDTSAPARIIAIGRLTIERPQITLHVLALGILDFDRGEIDLAARLVNSRLLGGDLSGDSAIMVRWGDNPDLLISIGGFHPAYKPPTDFTRRFGKLRRLSFRAHTNEKVLRLGLEAYLAVTSNTVQMGARVDFGVSVSAVSIDGMVAFDALIQWDPALYIDVMARGSVALKIGGVTLFGASVTAQLIGPGDWFVTGTATVSVLWWDVSVGFTIGDRPARPELPAVDGAAALAAALADPRSWGTQAASNQLVSVRRSNVPGGTLVFHPLDELTVRQQVVPLGMRVDRIEAGPLTTPRTFDVAVSVGGRTQATEPLSDSFARSKYVAMTDAQKLSAPSFQSMKSGVRVNLDAPTTTAPSIVANWTYDPFVLTAQGLQSAAPRAFAAEAALAEFVSAGGLS